MIRMDSTNAATAARRAIDNERRDALVKIYEREFAESAPQRAQSLLNFISRVPWYYTGPNNEVCRITSEDIVWWVAKRIEWIGCYK